MEHPPETLFKRQFHNKEQLVDMLNRFHINRFHIMSYCIYIVVATGSQWDGKKKPLKKLQNANQGFPI